MSTGIADSQSSAFDAVSVAEIMESNNSCIFYAAKSRHYFAFLPVTRIAVFQ
jgi:hypothetical protein